MSLINIVPTSPIVNIDVSAVSKVVLLPAASTCVGTTYNIRDWKAACSLINKIFLSTVGLDRVDGVSLSTTQLQMTSSLEIVKIMSLGNTAWSIVGRNKTVASTLGISIRPYIPLPAPLLVFGSLVFDGTLGSTSAAPKLTWSNSGGTVESYTLNLLSGSTSALGTSLSITPPAAGDTSYTYAGATVNDTFYSFLLVATNVTSSSTLSQPTPIRNRAAPVITLTSFTFGGTVGSTSAAPTLVWSSTGGAVESYALVVYGDANSTPTTVLSSTPPASGDLSYAYPGSTVNSFYYKMVLTATNVTGPDSVITTSVILNISPPSLSQTSFAFEGTKGSEDAEPTLNWSNSGGAVVSYDIVLWYGATTPPTNKLILTPAPAIGDTSYTYTGTTTAGFYYKFDLAANNAGGQNTLTTSIILNTLLSQWEPNTDTALNNREWTAVAISSDGTRFIATYYGGVYISVNSGSTWSSVSSLAFLNNWTAVAMTPDGSKAFATRSGGNIYISSYPFTSWTARATSISWGSIACSSDGTKLVAGVRNGYIWTSTDSGVNWSTNSDSSTFKYWYSVASSSDGTKLVAVINNSFTIGFIYRSTDSGVSWSVILSDAPRGWKSIACSSDGTILVAVSNYIWISTDSGANWSSALNDATRSWISIACSSDGSKIVAAINSGSIYVSTNSGASWSENLNDTVRYWAGVALTQDGTKAIAVASNNTPGIYIGT